MSSNRGSLLNEKKICLKKKKKITFEVFAYILEFVSSSRILLNLFLTIKNLFEYIQKENVYCCRNIIFSIPKTFPKKKMFFVYNIIFKKRKNEFERAKIDQLKGREVFPNLKKFTIFTKLNFTEEEIGNEYKIPLLKRLKKVYFIINSSRSKEIERKYFLKKQKKCNLKLGINLENVQNMEVLSIRFVNLLKKQKRMDEEFLYQNVRMLYPQNLDNLRELSLNNVVFEFSGSFVFIGLEKIHLRVCEIKITEFSDKNFPRIKSIRFIQLRGKQIEMIGIKGLKFLENLYISCDREYWIDLDGGNMVEFGFNQLKKRQTQRENSEKWFSKGKLAWLQCLSIINLKKLTLILNDHMGEDFTNKKLIWNRNNIEKVYVKLPNIHEKVNLLKIRELELVCCKFHMNLEELSFLEKINIYKCEYNNRFLIRKLPNVKFIVIKDRELICHDGEMIVVEDCPKLKRINLTKSFQSKLMMRKTPKLGNVILNYSDVDCLFKDGLPLLEKAATFNGFILFRKPEEMDNLRDLFICSHKSPANFISKSAQNQFNLLPSIEVIVVEVVNGTSEMSNSRFLFDNCVNLKILKLFNVDNVSIKYLPNLEILELRSNVEIVENLPKLKVLKIFLSCEYLPIKSIRNLPKLEELLIEMNEKNYVKLQNFEKKPVWINLSYLNKLKIITIHKKVESLVNLSDESMLRYSKFEVDFVSEFNKSQIIVEYYLFEKNEFKKQYIIQLITPKLISPKVVHGTNLLNLPSDVFSIILEFIYLPQTFLSIFSSCKTIKSIMSNEFWKNNIVWSLFRDILPRKFELVYVRNVVIVKKDIRDYQLTEFLNIFVNLESLDLSLCQKLSTDIFQTVPHLKKLKSLKIGIISCVESKNTGKNLSNLEELKIIYPTCLRSFEITLWCIKKTWNYIKTKELENLKLKVLHVTLDTVDEIRGVNLKSLKELDLSMCLPKNNLMSEQISKDLSILSKMTIRNCLLSLTFFKYQTQLEDLEIQNCKMENGNFLVDDIMCHKNMLSLKKLSICGENCFTSRIVMYFPKLTHFQMKGFNGNILTPTSVEKLKTLKKVLICCKNRKAIHNFEYIRCSCRENACHVFCEECKECFNCKEKMCILEKSFCDLGKHYVHSGNFCSEICSKCEKRSCIKCSYFHKISRCCCEKSLPNSKLTCSNCKSSFKECDICGEKICGDLYCSIFCRGCKNIVCINCRPKHSFCNRCEQIIDCEFCVNCTKVANCKICDEGICKSKSCSRKCHSCCSYVCSKGCGFECEKCKIFGCVYCFIEYSVCTSCKKSSCDGCQIVDSCLECNRKFCSNCMEESECCGELFCSECAVKYECKSCGKRICVGNSNIGESYCSTECIYCKEKFCEFCSDICTTCYENFCKFCKHVCELTVS